MRVLTVVGARPQFIKCAVVSRALRGAHEEFLLHTGQHFDHAMSQLFFDELDIPEPDENLEISGGLHGAMTGRMMEAIEQVAMRQKPDWMLVYGDTNSTMAAALVASKLHIPVAHVEAGLRSFNREMPEEVNRVVTDHLSTLLLCPTDNAVRLLAAEGVTEGVKNVGDVMYDSVVYQLERARARETLESAFAALAFRPASDGRFALATVHRPENTDAPDRLASILSALSSLEVPVLLPLHPRTRRVLESSPELSAKVSGALQIVDPIGYHRLLLLASAASLILTDSGGLQKEAYFCGARCVTMRGETEWVETVELGVNVVVGSDSDAIRAEAEKALAQGRLEAPAADGPFGDGHAGERIVRALAQFRT